MRKALAFDDVLLVPKHSNISSRDTVSTETIVAGVPLSCPILSSNMATVTGESMLREMSYQGGLGVLDRTEIHPHIVASFAHDALPYSLDPYLMAASVGVGDDAFSTASMYHQEGCPIICIDVAHGHTEKVLDLTNKLLTKHPSLSVIAGNIATKEAFKFFALNVDPSLHPRLALKVGVGSGSMCTTRIVTGFGLPTLQSLLDIKECRSPKKDDITLIADGGIKNSGDIVKALAAGADAVMLGSLLAGTDEAPGAVIKDGRTGDKFKVYRGSASFGTKQNSIGNLTYIEGEETLVPYKGKVEPILRSLMAGVRSGLSYNGSPTISHLQSSATFVQISTSGFVESKPHLL